MYKRIQSKSFKKKFIFIFYQGFKKIKFENFFKYTKLIYFQLDMNELLIGSYSM